MARNMTASVVTLMPPPVEADPPPTNMRASMRSRDSGRCTSGLSIANPPERVMIEPKSEWPTRSQNVRSPCVSGLPDSKTKSRTAPSTSRISVTSTVSLVCRFHARKRHPLSISTMTTGKPSAPANTPTAITVRITGSCANSAMPPGWMANPALLNALME